jgi:hypothetical protein
MTPKKTPGICDRIRPSVNGINPPLPLEQSNYFSSILERSLLNLNGQNIDY